MLKPVIRKLHALIWVAVLAACRLSGPTPAPPQTGPDGIPTAVPTAAPRAMSTAAAVPTAAPTPAPAVIPWWNETVFYEVFVRSYYDTGSDGIGDLNGLIQKLDYLNDGDPATTSDLGITGIWLMPVTESPSYHGYDVVDYRAVDQEYGSRDDFKRLMDEAHQRGIRVIIDLVLNHTSSQHPWFLESKNGSPQYRDWYLWSDTDPGYRGPWDQIVWHPANGSYYYAVFWEGMPDLNLENPQVTDELYQVTRFWLEEMGVDGFRMDAIRHFVEMDRIQENSRDTHDWLQAYHQLYKSIDPQALTVGEAWTTTDQVLDYVGDEVDIAFEFDLAQAFMSAANGPIALSAVNQMRTVLENYPAGQYGVFLTNHDQDRVMSVLKDETKAKLAATMLLTAPGVPFVYYGEEIGMTGVKPDEDIRRPMQWTAESPGVGFSTAAPWRAAASDFGERSVAAQEQDPASLLNAYRSLIQLRSGSAALRTGAAQLVETGTPRLYALLRYDDEQAFLVLVNVHPRALNAELYSLSLESGPFKAPVQAVSVYGQPDPAAPEINAGGGFSGYVPFAEIPGQSSVIIRLTP